LATVIGEQRHHIIADCVWRANGLGSGFAMTVAFGEKYCRIESRRNLALADSKERLDQGGARIEPPTTYKDS
jgi:hypothetical protein